MIHSMSLCPSDIRRCRIFPSKKDLKFGGNEAGAPIPSQSTIAINEDPAAMNEDPAMLHVDDGLKAPLLKALDVLDHVDDDGITEESIDHSLLSIMEYLHGMFDGLFGKHSGDAKYFKKYGKMLIIQETDVEEMEIQGASLCYSTSAGQLAGLNLDHRPFLKRIHILVDSKEGAYGADNLHANYHYQVKMADLKQHLKDIANQKVQVRIAGMNGCGVFDGAGICKIGCPTANQPDCIVYTASNPFAVAYSKSKKSDDKGGVSSSEPAFFCAIGKGVHDFRPLVDQLRIDKMHRYLVERGRSDDCGAAQRNQKSTVHFGLSFMNCTNVERGELHYLPSPEITKSLDKEPGIDEDETMSVTMRKSMLSMTQLMDAMCRVFDIPYLYNDQDCTETYASEIIVGNRLEHGIVDICNDDGDQDGLACHVDNQNGRKKGYTMNISYFKYIRNKNVVSPGNKKYYERIHEGGYGRKICDSTLERADNITRLLEDLSVYMSKLPECVVRYDPDMLLNRMKGDVNTEHNDDVVGRKIHMNKSVFFSFYVYVLSGWINRRKVKNVPVSWSELIEAVTTAVRWTTSPSSWANIFNIVTDDDGVMVKVPNEIHLSESLRRKMNQKMGRKMPKTNTYDSPFPLYILYIFKSIELLGGMAIGKIRRFQPFHGLSHIDLQRETESIRNNFRLINKLVNDTAKAKKNFPRDVETDDELLEWASNIATITRAYITDAAKTIRNGGVLGLGELLCHHFVGILSHGGWIDVAHGLNTSFSKGNGTSDFLLSEYGLDIVKIPKIIDVVARASCFEKFHLHRRPVAENSTCKMGQEWRRGTSTEFLDTVCIANDSFLSDIYEGKLVARRKGGVTTKINSGIVTCADQTTRDRFDFTVMFQSNQQQEVSAQWFQHNFELAVHTFPKSVFKAIDNNAKKKRKEQEKIQKEMQKKISTWNTSQQRSSLCSVWKDRSRKWGYVDKSPRRIHNIVKKQAHLLLQEILFHRMLVINHIGEMSSYQIIERIVKQFKKEDGDKLEQLRLEVNKMVIALHDVDNVNEVEHGLKTDSDNWFDEITKRVGRKETLHTKKRKRTLRSIVAKTTESDDRGLMDEDFNEKERRKDGIDYDIIDLDPTYQDGDGSTNYFILAGNRLVPTYYALKEVSSNYRVNCEINVEIANAAEKSTDFVNKTISYEKLVYNNWTFFNCTLQLDSVTSHRSCDYQFFNGKRGKMKHVFSIGMHKIDSGYYYETRTHAKLALLMVLMIVRDPTSIEKRFLSGQDFAVLTPNEHWAFNINDGTDVRLKQQPILCFMRASNQIIVLDMDQLRYLDFQKERSFSEEVTKKRNPGKCKTEIVIRDKTAVYHDEVLKGWKDLPRQKKSYFQMKIARHSRDKNNGTVVSYLAEAIMLIHFQLPVGTIKTEKSGKDMPPGWCKLKVMHNIKESSRTDNYWFSPKCKYRLRSKVEVDLFLDCLSEMDGNEVRAMEFFPERNNKRKKEAKLEEQIRIKETK